MNRPELKVLHQLLVPGTLNQKGAYGRELKVFKTLRREIDDIDFWLNLKPAIPLNSLLYFKSDYAMAQLKLDYGMFKLEKAERQRAEQAQLDREIQELEQHLEPIPLDTTNKTNRVKRKSVIEWADEPPL